MPLLALILAREKKLEGFFLKFHIYTVYIPGITTDFPGFSSSNFQVYFERVKLIQWP
jgi:hypothetical protein